MKKRKANRVKPRLLTENYCIVINYSNDYTAGIIHKQKNDIVYTCQHSDFNGLLINLYNTACDLKIRHLINETVLYNGNEKLAFSAWPPPLSLAFIENFFKKKAAKGRP